MINSGCLYSVLPTNEVISVLELAIAGKLEEFINHSRLYLSNKAPHPSAITINSEDLVASSIEGK